MWSQRPNALKKCAGTCCTYNPGKDPKFKYTKAGCEMLQAVCIAHQRDCL